VLPSDQYAQIVHSRAFAPVLQVLRRVGGRAWRVAEHVLRVVWVQILQGVLWDRVLMTPVRVYHRAQKHIRY
jgi:hypothetical protein